MSGVCFGIGLWNFFAVREPESVAKEPIVCWEDQIEIQYTRSGQQHLGSRAGPARLARLAHFAGILWSTSVIRETRPLGRLTRE